MPLRRQSRRLRLHPEGNGDARTGPPRDPHEDVMADQPSAAPSREYAYTGSARIVSAYAVHDDDRFVCPCGWQGSLTELDTEIFDELADGSCPKCDRMLLIREFPTLAQMRRWAARGNAEAARDLAGAEQALVSSRPGSSRTGP